MEPATTSTAESRTPNPKAIAWYVSQAEAVLDDLRGRVQSLRISGESTSEPPSRPAPPSGSKPRPETWLPHLSHKDQRA
jgi:hypothetical protein